MRVPIEDLRLFKLLGETMNFPYQQRTTIPTPQPANPSRMAAQDSPLGEELFFMVEQIHHEFHTRMHTALTGVGLDVRQYTTLAFIATGTGRAQNDLATILHLDPSQVVKLTKALEAAGLLTRDTRRRTVDPRCSRSPMRARSSIRKPQHWYDKYKNL